MTSEFESRYVLQIRHNLYPVYTGGFSRKKLRIGMDTNTSNQCISCEAILNKKLVKSLCPSCYRKSNRKTEICIDCKKQKLNTFVKGRCQSCRSLHDRAINPETYSLSRVKNKKNKSEYDRQYAYLHKKEKSAREAKRRAAKLQATPKWSNLEEIERIYKNRPSDAEVDHIIPLKGRNICGLHVPENLQYLSESENTKKNNKFDGTPENNGWRVRWL